MKKLSRFQLIWMLAAVLSLLCVGIAHAQYQGIWKDEGLPSTYGFYIQHYSSGATVVIYTTDGTTFHAFLGDMSGATFEADSLDSETDPSRNIQIMFVSDNHGAAKITDNALPSQPVNLSIEKAFDAVRTMHSGIWKNTAGDFSMYVQDYESNSTIVIYTYDGVVFRAFQADISTFLFSATSMGAGDELMTLVFTGSGSGTVSVEPVVSGASPAVAGPFSYQIGRAFSPGALDVAFQATPTSGLVPLEVHFTDLSTIGMTSWHWEFGDNTTSDEQHPSHTYTTPGTYDVVVTMSNGTLTSSCIALDYIQVNLPAALIISGKVTVQGSGLPSVEVSASDGGGTDETDTAGNYSIAVPYNWSGAVTPSLTGYAFTPASGFFSNLTSDKILNFQAEEIKFAISGTVRLNGSGLSGVTVTASNGGGSAVSDDAGEYSVEVPYDWSGTISASLQGYNFTPATYSYSNQMDDQEGQDFEAAITISGRMTFGYLSDEGHPNTSLSVTGIGAISTDAEGYYTVQVPYDWSGTIQPSEEFALFGPSEIAYVNVTAPLFEQNFVTIVAEGQTNYHAISGDITFVGFSGSYSAVRIFFYNEEDSQYAYAKVDDTGTYYMMVPTNWSGTVTPTWMGMELVYFTPSSKSYSEVTDSSWNEGYQARLGMAGDSM
ncbi:MAG: PKD domain-containing protein [Deltaproteobacteria bacterium]|nr:PKD domain-containing protein [Deltaproteobacteria bacterium]